MTTAQAVFDHHLAAFAAGDVDEILVDYCEQSVMIYGADVWRGLGGAREFFNLWINDWLPAGSRFDLIDTHAIDNMIYLTWSAESDNYIFDFGTDTFIVNDGKFLQQTVATLHRRK